MTRARRYGSTQIAARPSATARPPAAGEQPDRHAGDDEHARQHQHQGDRRPEVGLEHDQAAEQRRDQPDRAPELAEGLRRSLAGEVRGRPDEDRELRELRRLEVRRAEGEPALRAVDLGRDHEHRDAEPERRQDRAPGASRRSRRWSKRGRGEHQPDAEDGVHPLPLEEGDRIGVAERGRRRGGAVDHHEPEGDEPERHEDEQALLELALGSLHPSRFCTSLLNSSPRCSKSRNWS